jgi:pSer/pThr/pTyr-binding forkhead associated (FHA) protein
MTDVFCTRCGHRNPSDSNFCSSCGSPLEQEAGDHPTINFQLEPATDEQAIEVALEDVPAGGMLVVRSGPNAGSKFALDKDVVTAGRHPDSDIFLDDITVSRRHVEVLRQPGGYVVRDVGSLNGTYVNRKRVEEGPLGNGDELQVGKFKLVFVAGSGGEP